MFVEKLYIWNEFGMHPSIFKTDDQAPVQAASCATSSRLPRRLSLMMNQKLHEETAP